MKKIIIISLFVFLLIQNVEAKKERILFDLKFEFAKGGEADLTITDTIYKGLPAIHYYMIARTTGITDKLFGVNDIYETIVDAKTLLPLKSIRNIKEGKYRWYNETYFYHDIDSLNSNKTGWIATPDNLVDIISVFFYFINQHLFNKIETGSIVTLPTYHGDKISDVSIKYVGETKVKTDLGEIKTYVLVPSVDKGKLLNRSDGVRFFISKEKKIPVLLEFDMKLGQLKALLRSYKINNVEQVTK
jgi:predicted small secreted protein